MIASRFPAYTFTQIDGLDFDDLVEHYGAALWLGEQETKSLTRKGKDA